LILAAVSVSEAVPERFASCCRGALGKAQFARERHFHVASFCSRVPYVLSEGVLGFQF
jgi:hypothetical protein